MGHKVLVVGGAGYIGSHCALMLKEQGFAPIILDNFSYGRRFIAERLGLPVAEGDFGQPDFIRDVLQTYRPDSVMHFAAFASVPDSVADPAKYYRNNVAATLVLLDAMRDAKIDKFVFSSTSATYGVSDKMPITEDVPQNPINPYGRTKLHMEHAVMDYAAAYGLKYMMYRYFNAAGASPSGLIGEAHDPETHLLPLVIYAAQGKLRLKVFGDDYPTPDGTNVRDYIHVNDISQAHILGLQKLIDGGDNGIYNIGNGTGYSNLQLIRMVEKVTGLTVPFDMAGRRAGDPPTLISGTEKLTSELGWKPEFPDLESIVTTAWNWHKQGITGA